MNSNLIKLLFAMCMLFVLILLLEWSLSESAEDNNADRLLTSEEGNKAIKLPEIALSKKAKESYTTMVEKPLFIKGRQPVEESVDVIEKTVDGKIDDLILDGLYTVDGRMVALMRESKAGKEYLKKSEGDEIAGWIIKEMRSDRIFLESGSDEKAVMLRKPRAKPRNIPKKPKKRKKVVPKKTKTRP